MSGNKNTRTEARTYISSPSKVVSDYRGNVISNEHLSLGVSDPQVSYQSGTDAATLSMMQQQQIAEMESHGRQKDEFNTSF